MSTVKPDANPVQERPCPICGRAATAAFTPFCSRRCADIDLNRWFSGAYRVAINEPDTEIEDVDNGPSPHRPSAER